MLIILAGLLPKPTLSVSVTGICMNLMALVYMISFGLSGAASTRVANCLGAGRPHAARRVATTSAFLSVLLTSAAALGLLLGRHHIGRLFSDDPGVIAATAGLAPFLAIAVVGDGLNATFSGVIRGAARQAIGVVINLGAYWGVGPPLLWLLGFHYHMGVKGFWISMATTATVQGLSMMAAGLSLDWDKEAQRAEAILESHMATAAAAADLEAADHERALLKSPIEEEP